MKKLITILLFLSFINNINAQDTTFAGVKFYQYKDSNNIVYYDTRNKWVSKSVADRVIAQAKKESYKTINNSNGIIYYSECCAVTIKRRRFWDGDIIYKISFLKRY